MTRPWFRQLLPFLVVGGMLFPSTALAQQPCNRTTSSEDFTLTPVQGTYLAFPSASVSDFSATWTVITKTYSLHVDPRKKNRAWDLCIRAAASTLLNGKPVGDMEWRVSGTSTWYPLSTSYAQIVRDTGAETVSLDFRIRLYWAGDAPALYGTLFTLAAY